MFGLFKKNKNEKKNTLNFVAPVDGKTMDI